MIRKQRESLRRLDRRPDELVQLRVNRRVHEPAFGRLGDAEVDHLRHRHAVVQRHKNVRRLDVAVNDALLVRVLNRLAHLDEETSRSFVERLA